MTHIPSAHLLDNRPWRVTPGGHYADRCACGTVIYGPTLPDLWDNHTLHLQHVRAQSANRHPSHRDET